MYIDGINFRTCIQCGILYALLNIRVNIIYRVVANKYYYWYDECNNFKFEQGMKKKNSLNPKNTEISVTTQQRRLEKKRKL